MTHARRRGVLPARLAAAFAAAILALVPGTAHGGVSALRVTMTAEPNSLSPLLALNDYEQFADRLIFDVLVSADPSGRFVPRLAREVPTTRNGGISADGLTITYRLRRGVRWHDGAPFTSRDVAFSLRAILNPANNVPDRHGYDLIARAETPDDYTIVFHMKQRFAPAIATLFSDSTPNPILPEHLLARYRDLNAVPFNAHPVGTGPFRFVRWERGSRIELEANRAYYLGAPKVEKLTIGFVPDENAAVIALRTGETDLFTIATEAAYLQMKSIPSIALSLTPIHGAGTLVMNNGSAPLRDRRVRLAIAHAIDKASIARRFLGGAAAVATADLPSFMWAFDPGVRTAAFDPALARAGLRAAGYTADAGGFMVRGGKPLDLVLAYPSDSASARLIATTIQAYLRDAGIRAELKGAPANVFYGSYAGGGILQRGSFDLAVYTMTASLDPDASDRFSCGAVPPAGLNYSRYCSPAMDAAQTAGLRTFDRAARKAAYAKSQALLAADVPIVFLYWPRDIDGFTPALRGFRPNPVTAAWNAHEWQLRK